MKNLGRAHSCFDAGSDTQYLVILISYLCPRKSEFVQKLMETAKPQRSHVLQCNNITL